MKRSSDRILTTHVGSLPRPRALLDLLLTQEKGDSVDPATFDREAARAVGDIVAQQVKSGIDIVSDGEMSKLSYTFYVNGRVNGIGKTAAVAERARDVMLSLDVLDHPDLMERQARNFAHVQFPPAWVRSVMATPRCWTRTSRGSAARSTWPSRWTHS